MKEVWLIRHAESLANIGAATETPQGIPLSENGFNQAKRLADSILPRPDLVIVSPYLRSQQTAQNLLNRFSDTTTEILPVQEFTYLSISHCRGTTHHERKPLVKTFWTRNDPNYCDGDQAESLAEFFHRTENFLLQMCDRSFELAFVFTHEQFIKALIWEVLHPKKVFDEKFMSEFQKFMISFSIPNTAVMKLKIEENNEFYIGKIETAHLENMLELKNITKTFGSVVANDNVSIKIEKGTIHAIVGENGAGKSTIMRVAYGFYAADSGEILVDGKAVSIKNPHDAIRLGIGMVHQHFMLVDTMTVAENIILGAETGGAANLDLDKANRDILALSNELRLGVNPKALIEDISVGAQQRVELLKALYRNAELLILDEPTAVLTPQETEEFFSILRRMREAGKTVVIITHKLEEVLAISDEVTVMRDGKTVGNVKTSETSAKDLARMIVGRDVLLRVEKTNAEPKNTILSVENLSVKTAHGDALNKVSFDVRAGEIVGIAGVEGNGQTELIEAVAGLVARQNLSGKIYFEGANITNFSARQRKESGIAHIPEDRHKRGLLLDSDLEENSILGVHYRPPVTAGGFLNATAIGTRTREIIENFDVRPPNPHLSAKSLSGGNQQKLIIGREFGLKPKLLLVSQPTRGVDIGAIEFIHRKLIALRDAGTAVLLVSAELEEVTALADRLIVVRKGKIVGEVNPQTTSSEEIGLLMTGGK